MNEQEILEGNKLIAEFMGWVCQTDPTERWFGCWFDNRLRKSDSKNPLLFHSSWDWLMPVVDKIEMLPNVMDFSIGTNYVSIEMKDNSTFGYTIFAGEKKEYTTYKTVTQFIKCYNKQ